MIRPRARAATGFVAALIAVLAGATPAAAGTKPYALKIAPGSVMAGTVSLTATFTNENANQQLGSANLTPPQGFTLVGTTQPETGTAAVVNNVLQLRGLSDSTQGGTRSVTMTVKTPAGCPGGTYSWSSEAKQANDFSGIPGNDLNLDTANSSLTTAVRGVCAVQFGVQPHSAVVTQQITGTDYDTSGPALTVRVVDSQGNTVPSSAPVTVAVKDNPGAGTLSGTQTVNAVNGVATFSDLSIDKPANGYTLAASSPGLSGSTSSSFNEQNQSTVCNENTSCQTDVGNAAGDMQVTASPDLLLPDAGLLYESVNAQNNVQLNCAGYTSADPNTYEFYVTSGNRSKTLTQTIRTPAIPLSGTTAAILGSQQECFGAPYTFITNAGTPAAAGTLPDGTPGFIGLLPNCGTAGATVCVASRTSKLDLSSPLGFDIVLTINVPEGLQGDPWTH